MEDAWARKLLLGGFAGGESPLVWHYALAVVCLDCVCVRVCVCVVCVCVVCVCVYVCMYVCIYVYIYIYTYIYIYIALAQWAVVCPDGTALAAEACVTMASMGLFDAAHLLQTWL